MKSNNYITLPPDDRRCHHLDGVNSSRYPNWAMADLPFCPKHVPATPLTLRSPLFRLPPVQGRLRAGRRRFRPLREAGLLAPRA
jgi:hypothetical protein